jgi:hypothetical protein
VVAIDRAFVDRVSAEAKQVHFWKTVLLAIAAVLFGLGWLIGKTFTVLWLVCTWTFAAVREGFREARKASG